LTAFEKPYEELSIITRDSVKLSGTILRRGIKKNNCIIILNSAARSRHQFGIVLLAEWLATDFDVVCFDIRGHFNSGGFWNPLDAVLDINDMVAYIKTLGYEKVGIFGKSIGGWSALMNAALEKSSDSVAILSAPLKQLQLNRKIQPYIKLYISWPRFILKPILEKIVKVRFNSLFSERQISKEIPNVFPTPMLLMYYQSDVLLDTTAIEAKQIFDKASKPKRFVVLDGIGHGLELYSFKRIATELSLWFKETL